MIVAACLESLQRHLANLLQDLSVVWVLLLLSIIPVEAFWLLLDLPVSFNLLDRLLLQLLFQRDRVFSVEHGALSCGCRPGEGLETTFLQLLVRRSHRYDLLGLADATVVHCFSLVVRRHQVVLMIDGRRRSLQLLCYDAIKWIRLLLFIGSFLLQLSFMLVTVYVSCAALDGLYLDRIIIFLTLRHCQLIMVNRRLGRLLQFELSRSSALCNFLAHDSSIAPRRSGRLV